MGNTEIAISWDENGLPYICEEYLDIISRITSDDIVVNEIPLMRIYNIGVGTAKDITLRWNTHKNIEQFMNILNRYDDVNIGFDGNIVYIETDSIKKALEVQKHAKLIFY